MNRQGAAVFYAAFAKSGVLQLLCAHSEVLCEQGWNGSTACTANVLVRLTGLHAASPRCCALCEQWVHHHIAAPALHHGLKSV